MEEHCQRGYIAGTIAPGYHEFFKMNFGGTFVATCPLFFQLPKLDEVIAKLDQDNPQLVLTSALTLVHEMQHVVLTTGEDRYCDDQVELSKTYAKGYGCYDVKW